jgi:starvation-inducible DNA-binding protein
MTTALHATPDTARLTAAATLQQVLPELVALTLNAKQAHWNLRGPAFLPLHRLTDELAADARTWADRVAERAVTLGYSVDARPETVAAMAASFPGGWLPDSEAAAELVKAISGAVATAHESLDHLEYSDVVAHDLMVDVLEGLEKYRWMLEAQAR